MLAAGAASVSLTLLASQVLAQSTESGSSPNLDEVVVTASRAEQPAMQALEAVIVIDHEVLETAQAVDIGDVLRSYPGLDIGRNSASHNRPDESACPVSSTLPSFENATA